MPTRFLAIMSSHQHCLPPRHGNALLGIRSTGPRSVSHLQWVSAHMHGVSSSSAQAYVLQSQTGTVNLFHIGLCDPSHLWRRLFCIIAQAPSPRGLSSNETDMCCSAYKVLCYSHPVIDCRL